MNIVIIGAGAAGCFAAIEIKRRCPEASVTVLERGPKALAKVAVTGGGRCNLTNSFANVKSMEQVYPRGHRVMKKLLHHFSHKDTYRWFENEGVALVTQEDECVFPQSQNAMQIVNTLLALMRRLDVKLVTSTTVENIKPTEGRYAIEAGSKVYHAEKVVVTTGGQPKLTGFNMLRELDIEIVPPLPSLFSLCISDKGLTALMGTVVEKAQVSLVGTKLKGDGALLITHWGISGPATLRLSAAAARVLAEKSYANTDISINWLAGTDTNGITRLLEDITQKHSQKKIASVYPEQLNARLWRHIITKAGLSPDTRWGEMQSKGRNRLLNILTNDTYRITGKNRFKEEFVTSGGVALGSLRHDTLEAKKHPGLYFAGEVTDVDAVTGGFNLQAAWTMGYVVAQAITR